MKLAAILACRNQSSRLYAKPLQNLDVEKGITILDYMLRQIKLRSTIEATVLAISEQPENNSYEDVAVKHDVFYVKGDDGDVLARLIKGAESVSAEHILRVSTESPYVFYDQLETLFDDHCKNEFDYSVAPGMPDGSFYELIKVEALKTSWEKGEDKHRSELCTLYIFENQEDFRIKKHDCPKEFARTDIRLTVDWPEDLIVMREIYKALELDPDTRLNFAQLVKFLDTNPKINAVNNWIDSGKGRVWY